MLLYISNFAGEKEKGTFLNKKFQPKNKKKLKKEPIKLFKLKLRNNQAAPVGKKVRVRIISAIKKQFQIVLLRKVQAIILATFLVAKFFKAPFPLMSLPEMNRQIIRKISLSSIHLNKKQIRKYNLMMPRKKKKMKI